jgi:phosphoribosylaminoimidazole-succinocarboxamide synthase
MTRELIAAVAKRYIAVYEKITGKKFAGFSYPIGDHIAKVITASLSS